jgi:Predicted transcriptional regulators
VKKMDRKQVANFIGISDRRILYYTECGILPKTNWNVGRGTSRNYSEHDIHILSIVNNLANIGFELNKIKKIIAYPNISKQ